MQHVPCKGHGSMWLPLQPGHRELHVQVPRLHTSLPAVHRVWSLSTGSAVARGMGCLSLQAPQLCVHFLLVANTEHQLPRGYAQGHLLSGKSSPALPSLTTWLLLQLNETMEPCMVRMDSTWGTLPATI